MYLPTGLIALRPSALGAFEITSDLDSRIAEYQARKKYCEGSGATFLVIALAYIPLSITLEIYAFLGVTVAFAIVAYSLLRPVGRYKAIIARLTAERDISEV